MEINLQRFEGLKRFEGFQVDVSSSHIFCNIGSYEAAGSILLVMTDFLPDHLRFRCLKPGLKFW